MVLIYFNGQWCLTTFHMVFVYFCIFFGQMCTSGSQVISFVITLMRKKPWPMMNEIVFFSFFLFKSQYSRSEDLLCSSCYKLSVPPSPPAVPLPAPSLPTHTQFRYWNFKTQCYSLLERIWPYLWSIHYRISAIVRRDRRNFPSLLFVICLSATWKRALTR